MFLSLNTTHFQRKEWECTWLCTEAGEGDKGACVVPFCEVGLITPSEDCWVEDERMDSEDDDARLRNWSAAPRSLRRSLSSSLEKYGQF